MGFGLPVIFWDFGVVIESFEYQVDMNITSFRNKNNY